MHRQRRGGRTVPVRPGQQGVQHRRRQSHRAQPLPRLQSGGQQPRAVAKLDLHSIAELTKYAIREGLTDVLVYHGYDVDSAATGPEGLRKALSGKFDLVLLDIMLPGIDGYEICDRIRAEDRLQPIIMLTARGFASDVLRGREVGAAGYITKPFTADEVIRRVRAILG